MNARLGTEDGERPVRERLWVLERVAPVVAVVARKPAYPTDCSDGVAAAGGCGLVLPALVTAAGGGWDLPGFFLPVLVTAAGTGDPLVAYRCSLCVGESHYEHSCGVEKGPLRKERI